MDERQPHDDPRAKQRRKNLALLLTLVGFVVIIYLVTIVRIGGH